MSTTRYIIMYYCTNSTLHCIYSLNFILFLFFEESPLRNKNPHTLITFINKFDNNLRSVIFLCKVVFVWVNDPLTIGSAGVYEENITNTT